MSNATELTVNGLWAAPEDNGIDLDGRCLMTRPEGIDEWNEDKRLQWLNDNGYDLSIDFSEEGVWLHAVATNVTVIPNEKWEDTNLAWISEILQPGSQSSPLILWQLPEGILPVTFAFRTMNGTSGLFRLTAYSLDKKQATIQIKVA